MAVVVNYFARSRVVFDELFLNPHRISVWAQSNLCGDDFRFCETRQEVVAALPYGHGVVLVHVQVVRVVLPTAPERDRLKSRNDVRVVVGVKERFDPRREHLPVRNERFFYCLE